jgi:hypothetical protein
MGRRLSLYLFFGLAVSLALFLFLTKDGRMARDARIYCLLPLMFWLVLDARWQMSLVQQTAQTMRVFSGKSVEEKLGAAEDGRIYKLMQVFGAKMPLPSKDAKTAYRVFVFSDEEPTRGRAAYHLYPRNAFALPRIGEMLAANAYKSGDYIALIDKKGVKFNPQTQALTWGLADSINVELLHYENGNGLFRVGASGVVGAVVPVPPGAPAVNSKVGAPK